MRISNTAEKNITFDCSRKRYRVEMRIASIGSRTARVRTLEAAVALRDQWAAERDGILASTKAQEQQLSRPAFSIEVKPVVLHFD